MEHQAMTVKKTQQTLNTTLEKAEQSLNGLEAALVNNVGGSLLANNGLPEGWGTGTLGELVVVERGSSPRPIKEYVTHDGSGVNWVKIGDTKEGQKFVTVTKEKITEEGALKSRFVDIGDFILSNSMSFGRPYIMGIQGYIHDGWFALRLPAQIETNYFYYLLSSSYIKDQFDLLAVGGVVKNISGELVKKAVLPLPPLAEQTVIAQTLDTLLAQVDNIKTRLDAIPNILKTFRQSVLAAAVSGKLTEEWRGENECELVELFVEEIKSARFKLWRETELNKFKEKGKAPPKNFEAKYKYPEPGGNKLDLPKTWSVMSWNQISMWITYGFTKPMPHIEEGPLIITAKNVRLNEVDLKGAHKTTEEAYNSLRP